MELSDVIIIMLDNFDSGAGEKYMYNFDWNTIQGVQKIMVQTEAAGRISEFTSHQDYHRGLNLLKGTQRLKYDMMSNTNTPYNTIYCTLLR